MSFPFVAALDQARRFPEDPWLFAPFGWDFRWLSWAAGLERILELAGRLEDGGARSPASSELLAHDGTPTLWNLLLHLAAQLAGLPCLVLDEVGGDDVSAARRARHAGATTWVRFGNEAAAAPGEQPAPSRRFPPSDDLPALLELPRLSGPKRAGHRLEPERWTKVLAGIETLAAALPSEALPSPDPAARTGDGTRPVAFLGRSLGSPASAALLAWSAQQGAGLVLAGDERTSESGEGRSGLARWSRPTAAALDPASRRRLADSALAPPKRWRTADPLGRLEVLWLAGDDAVDRDEREAWSGRGVTLCRAPADGSGAAPNSGA